MSAQANFSPRSPFVPIGKFKIKCPVCGHKDNCAITEDRSVVFCRRVPSAYPGTGGWTHVLSDSQPQPAPKVNKPAPAVAPVADRKMRDTGYRSLLSALPLLPGHRDNLLARGLDLTAIERGMFRSTPTEEEAVQLTREISDAHDLAGIPGFYRERDAWQLVHAPAGFFVPVLDREGLIQGLQVRRDYLKHEKDSRYCWLSSANRPFGTSSGAPCHVQNPERIAATGKCMITEGALKSFIAAQYLDESEGGLMALAGVSIFQDSFGLRLKQAFPDLRSVAIAFDSDWQSKKEVKAQLLRLTRVLRGANFESITIRTWPTNEKGIDDYLVAEAREVNR